MALFESFVQICILRVTTANFWQAGPPQWRPHQQCAIAAAAFYSAKSRQGQGLGGPALQKNVGLLDLGWLFVTSIL